MLGGREWQCHGLHNRKTMEAAMTFEPLFLSPPIIQFHALAATLALILGPVAVLRRSRDRWHKVLGYLWVLAMLAASISSFWINSLQIVGPFGPIHILSVYVLWSLWEGINAARRGDTVTHRTTMVGLYFWALCITGMITLTPGRRLNEALLGGSNVLGIVVPLIVITVLLVTVYRKRVLPLGKIGDTH